MSRSYPPVSVFGVPTDIGASRRGASMGPEALRVAGLVEAIAARGIDARDLGDVQGPRNPTLPPVDGYRHLDEVVAWNRAVFEMSTRELQAERMPILLGSGPEVLDELARGAEFVRLSSSASSWDPWRSSSCAGRWRSARAM